jgi:hypothetical protein
MLWSAPLYSPTLLCQVQIWNLVGNIAWGERYQDIIPHVLSAVDASDARLFDALAQVRREEIESLVCAGGWRAWWRQRRGAAAGGYGSVLTECCPHPTVIASIV